MIVVEHDEEAIRSADHIIDIGPGAGKHGGEICAQGNIDAILKNKNSITAKYLSGKRKIKVPKKRLKINSFGIPVKLKIDYDPNDHKNDFGGISRLRDYPPPDSPISYGVEAAFGGLNLGLYHENLNQLSFRWTWSKNLSLIHI